MKKIFNVFLSVALMFTASVGFYMPQARAALSDGYVKSWGGDYSRLVDDVTSYDVCFLSDINVSDTSSAYAEVTLPAGLSWSTVGSLSTAVTPKTRSSATVTEHEWTPTNVSITGQTLRADFTVDAVDIIDSDDRFCLDMQTNVSNYVAIANPSTSGNYTISMTLSDGTSSSSGSMTYTVYDQYGYGDMDITIDSHDNGAVNSSPVIFSFDIISILERSRFGNMVLNMNNHNAFEFNTSADLMSACSMTAGGSSVTLAGANISNSSMISFTLPTGLHTLPVGSTFEITCNGTVVDKNNDNPGVYDVDVSIADAETGHAATYTNNFAVEGISSAGAPNVNNSNTGEAPGPITLTFTPSVEIPANGANHVRVDFPSEYVADDIDGTSGNHLWNHVTMESGGEGSTTINLNQNDSLTKLTSKSLTLTPATNIPGDQVVSIGLDSTVIDQNPATDGSYDISIYMDYGTGNDTTTVSTTVSPAIVPAMNSLDTTLSNNNQNATAVSLDVAFTPNIDIPADGASTITVEIPDSFMVGNIDGGGGNHMWDHVDVTYGSGEGSTTVNLVENDSLTKLVSRLATLTVDTLIPAGQPVSVEFHSTVIDQNPVFGGVYNFSYGISNNTTGQSASANEDVLIGAALGSLNTTLTNTNADEAPGAVSLQFTPTIGLPDDGASTITIQFPDGFLMDDIDGDGEGNNLWNHVTVSEDLGEGSSSISLVQDDALTNLRNNIVTLTVDTNINGGNPITVNLDSTVVDKNPVFHGEYSISYGVYNDTTGDSGTAEEIIDITISGHDYTSDGPTVNLVNSGTGQTKLPAGEDTAIFADNQEIDFASDLTSGNPSEVIGSSTVGDELADLIGEGETVTGVQEVAISVGDGASSSDVQIVGPSATTTLDSGTAIIGASSTGSGDGVWDGTFTTPSSDDSISRIGFTRNAASKIGSDNAPLVMDQPIKIDLSSVDGDPYYSSNGVTWYKISECPQDADLSSPGSLDFAQVCYLEDSGTTVIWSYHLTTFGTLTHNAVLTLGNSTEGEDPGTMDFSFTSGNTIPVGGELTISFPDEFTISDNADISGYINTFTDDTSPVTVSSASLTDNVITIVIGSEISQDSELVLNFDTGLVTSSPATPGQYAVALLTKDDEGTTIGTGYVNANVGDEISVTATVQEALILTIEEGDAINLNVDPSVNDGEDFSQKTVLQVKTNAANGYKVQAFLSNGAGVAQLQNGANYISSASIYGEGYVPNTFSYLAYNNDNGTDPLAKTKAELKIDIEAVSNSAPFSASSADMTLYDGTASGIGNANQTNAQNHTIYYLLFVDYMTQAGIYSGEVVYTAYPTF